MCCCGRQVGGRAEVGSFSGVLGIYLGNKNWLFGVGDFDFLEGRAHC